MVLSHLYYCLKLTQEKKGCKKILLKSNDFLMSNDDCDDGNLDFTACISITSQLFTYSHHREREVRPTCSGMSWEDLWSAHPVPSPHYHSPLPPLERLLAMTVFVTPAKLFFLSSSPSPKHL